MKSNKLEKEKCKNLKIKKLKDISNFANEHFQRTTSQWPRIRVRKFDNF